VQGPVGEVGGAADETLGALRSVPPATTRRLVAAALFVVAVAVRFWGIGWGMPARYDLHPDETEHVMSHALAVSLADPDPKFLNYPSFLIYLIAVTNGLLSRLGWVGEVWQAHVIARSIVALFGSLTVPAAYWLATWMDASPLGPVLAGLWVALLPLHVWESHFAVTDVVMTFWIVVALGLSARIVRRGGDWRAFAAVGAVIGFGIASKYTAALVGLSPLVAAVLARPLEVRLSHLVALGAGAAVCAFVGTPFSFIHPRQLLDAMAFEYEHVHSLHYGFSLPASGWQYHKYVYELFAGFPFSLGFALWASAAAGTLWAVASMRRTFVPVFAFAIVFFAILGGWTFTPLRYQLPVVVVGAVFAGLWQGAWLSSGSRPRRALAAAAVLATLGYTTIFTLQTTDRFRHDTRIEAARWLDETLKPGTRLLVCGYRPYLAAPTRPEISVTFVNEAWISRLQERSDFDVVEISGLHYWRHERHQHHAFFPAYERFRHGGTGFRLVKRFEADFLNRDLYRRLDPMFAGYFVSPTLEFYERGGGA
jgi:dolichyl-phosphate-mannose-protein mannosyltransferase